MCNSYTMKNIPTIMLSCFFVCFVSCGMGNTLKNDDQIFPPSFYKIQEKNPLLLEMKDALHKEKIKDFYNQAMKMFHILHHQDLENISYEDVGDQLWVLYYVARAPLLTVDYSPDTPYDGDVIDNKDLVVKEFGIIQIFCMENSVCGFSQLKKEGVQKICAQYSAFILKSLRGGYDKDIEVDVEKVRSNFKRSINFKPENSEDELRKIQTNIRTVYNKTHVSKARNKKLLVMINNLEGRFLNMLINCFSGKKTEVIRYVRMAGYEDNEINSLIDRTVGRDLRTEFLYKGRSKKAAR